MTYKRADRPGWPRVLARRFICQRLTDAGVEGAISLYQMVEVAEPLLVPYGEQQVRIADAGYCWVQVFPAGAYHTHTTMFDATGQPVQDYIDIVAEQGIGEDGIPWYDDLYLDLAWSSDDSPQLLDQEELEAAYAIEAITQEQYDLARNETARVLFALTMGDYTLPELTRAWYPRLLAALDELPSAPTADAPEIADMPETADTAPTVSVPAVSADAASSAPVETLPAPEESERSAGAEMSVTATATATAEVSVPADATDSDVSKANTEDESEQTEQSAEDGEQDA